MNTSMIQKFTAEEKVYTFKKLGHFGRINYRGVEQTVIGYGVGGLSVSVGIADAYGHDFPLNEILVYANVHVVVHPLEG